MRGVTGPAFAHPSGPPRRRRAPTRARRARSWRRPTRWCLRRARWHRWPRCGARCSRARRRPLCARSRAGTSCRGSACWRSRSAAGPAGASWTCARSGAARRARWTSWAACCSTCARPCRRRGRARAGAPALAGRCRPWLGVAVAGCSVMAARVAELGRLAAESVPGHAANAGPETGVLASGVSHGQSAHR